MKRTREMRPGSLPFEEWPEADRSAWKEAFAPTSSRQTGRAAHFSPKNGRTLERRYGVALFWLQRTRPGLLEIAPPLRFADETIDAYVEWREPQVAPVTLAGEVRDIREALRVMFPLADLSSLTEAVLDLKGWAKPARDKDVRFRHSRDIFDAGLACAAEAREAAASPGHRAARFRDGVMVAFLALRPVRLANLTAIDLLQHMSRRGSAWWFRFEPRELKDRGGIALEFSLPEELEPWFHEYLKVWRPILLGRRRSDRLWISTRFTPLSEQAIWQQISKLTKERLDVAINPHMFRDCAATSVAIDEPGSIEIIARILGHRCLATSQRHYLRLAHMQGAVDRHAATLHRRRGMGQDDGGEAPRRTS